MAAAFFQGTLGQFASYSSFGNVGSQLGGQDQQAIAQGRQAAMGGGYSPQPQLSGKDSGGGWGAAQTNTVRTVNMGGDSVASNADAMKYAAPNPNQTRDS